MNINKPKIAVPEPAKKIETRHGRKYKIVKLNLLILLLFEIISLLIKHNKDRDATAEVEGTSKKPKLLIHIPIGPIKTLIAYPSLPVVNDCISCRNILLKKKILIKLKKTFGILLYKIWSLELKVIIKKEIIAKRFI